MAFRQGEFAGSENPTRLEGLPVMEAYLRSDGLLDRR